MMADGKAKRLSFLALFGLGAPAFPMFALMMPLVVFIPAFYADNMGLGMATVGTIFLVARIFDAVTDPLAGSIMDKTQAVISRKGWVVIGAIPLFLATWQIFLTPGSKGAVEFTVWLLVLYAGWTLMSVGLYSWAGEAGSNYNERSRIMGAIQIANSLGTIGVLLLPVVLEISGDSENVAQTRIWVMGAFILIALPVVLLLAWFLAPNGQVAKKPGRVIPALKQALKNPAMLRLLAADFIVGCKAGIATALGIFFIEIVSDLPGRAGTLQLLSLVASLLAIPVFVRLSEHFEKHHVLVLNALAAAIAGAIALIAPVGTLWIVAMIYFLFGVANGSTQLLIRSIMADIVDEEYALSGNSNSGLYFSFLTTTLKLSLSIGVTASFWTAAALGFDPSLARLDDSAHWVIRTLLGVGPIVAVALLAAVMWRFPMRREDLSAAPSDAAS